MSIIDDSAPTYAIESRAPLEDRTQYALAEIDQAAHRMWGDEDTWTPIQRAVYLSAIRDIHTAYAADSADGDRGVAS